MAAKPRRRRWPWVLLMVVVLAVVLNVGLDKLYQYRLHEALGYGAVYAKNMWLTLGARYGGAVLYAMLGLWALRPLMRLWPRWGTRIMGTAAVLIGWAIGYGMGSINPTDWYLAFSHASFGRADPLHHLDYSFYVYVWPLLEAVLGRLVGTLALFAAARAACLAVLWLRQYVVTRASDKVEVSVRGQARVLLALLSAIFVVLAALAALQRYGLMLAGGNQSFVYGPDFVNARLVIPVFTWFHALTLLALALALAVAAWRVDQVLPSEDGFVRPAGRVWRRVVQAGALTVSGYVFTWIVSALVNGLYVHPNQSTAELPYIQDTISATRYGLNIEQVDAKPFQAAATLTKAAVEKDKNALDNVRVNDQGQTTSIYNQLQSFKSYFTFAKAAVDRYDGHEVYVAARELDSSQLPVKTWVNTTLVYTHGYGLAASPVNQFDQDGLPTILAGNTPQTTTAPFPKITRPEIYFGLRGQNVIAPSKQPEFDYPVGSSDKSSHYRGGYGLPINGNRLLLTIKQGTLRFFTSDQLTDKSEWLFDRNIYKRVQDIAPFLRYDHDAFPFVDSRGHILWMLDAYTETDNIPYAQPFMGADYLRNSVKVVVDAYTGQVTFYAIDTRDPLLQSLMRVYPGLFTTQVPADVRAHFRYPQDLFAAQAEALTRYHMTDASAFYNREDQWQLAKQIYHQNETTTRPPVYQMIRMPGETAPHFVLSALFTPNGKDNLNGWLIAHNDPGNYGRLTLYQFPQSQLQFGPLQAENQIDSDPTISQQLSLWNQQGSHVVRGDLLLVPVGDSLLYIEPVYLVASRENSLPQLERVIVDYNKQVYMGTSLASAIDNLLSAVSPNTPQPNAPSGAGTGTSGAGGQSGAGAGAGQGTGAGQGAGMNTGGSTTGGAGAGAGGTDAASLAQQANQWFQRYTEDTAKGDFEAAGKDLKQLGDVLARLQALTKAGGNQQR
ncbi:UPF0182 family protein [Alicyclobacillus kakegawensis]|uniref:UPF0182 family protein n=1 Tax=Alicyclobacillus kakegawensis TaxID=392012 RepID=UPI00082AC5EF|nr:UPF0182 family protein [Alicyclobacillus kakegawensis]